MKMSPPTQLQFFHRRHFIRLCLQLPTIPAITTALLAATKTPGKNLSSIRQIFENSYTLQRKNNTRTFTTTSNTNIINDDNKTNHSTRSGDGSVVVTVNPDRSAATKMVDQLFERTKQLMVATATATATNDIDVPMSTASPINSFPNNRNVNCNVYHHTIAYSGGIDSSLVTALIHQISIDLNMNRNTSSNADRQHQPQHNVTAILGISPAVSMEQIDQAKVVANHIGVPFVEISTNEGSDETYIQNNGQACFACKSELYTKLIHHTITQYTQKKYNYSDKDDDNDKKLSVHTDADLIGNEDTVSSRQSNNNSIDTTNFAISKVYNGTNADDCTDPTRVGLIAATKFNVISPLQYTTKNDVRIIAKHLGLPNWNVASNPCLRSRLALGVLATKEHLHRIELMERFIRQQLVLQSINITVETNLRVRQLPQQHACFEIDTSFVQDCTAIYQQNKNEWDAIILNQLQFHSFSIRPFRSGSVAGNGTGKTATATATTAATTNVSITRTSPLAAATTSTTPFVTPL